MIALLEHALALSLAFWATLFALVVVTAAMVVLAALRWGCGVGAEER